MIQPNRIKFLIFLFFSIYLYTIGSSQKVIQYGDNHYNIYNEQEKIKYYTGSKIYEGEYCFQYFEYKNDTIFLTNEFYLKNDTKNYVTEYKIKLDTSSKLTVIINEDMHNNAFVLKISTIDYSIKYKYTMYNMVGPSSDSGFVFELPVVFKSKESAIKLKEELIK